MLQKACAIVRTFFDIVVVLRCAILRPSCPNADERGRPTNCDECMECLNPGVDSHNLN